jgi:hypothetical protein
MQEEAVRWSIKVSKDTDLTLRTFLGAQGAKKGDLSKFIEEAVRSRCSSAPFRTSGRGTPMPIRMKFNASLTKPSARFAANVGPNRRPTKPDARRA